MENNIENMKNNLDVMLKSVQGLTTGLEKQLKGVYISDPELAKKFNQALMDAKIPDAVNKMKQDITKVNHSLKNMK